MHLSHIPLSLGLLLQAATAVLAWDHLDRSHPSRRTLHSFRWTRPFLDLDLAAGDDKASGKNGLDRDVPGGFHISCLAVSSFPAKQYTAADLRRPYPDGLEAWAPMLEHSVEDRTYPGGWEGDELKGDDKLLLLMELTDVPATVRAFVEHKDMDGHSAKRWHFSVLDKPGAAPDSAAAGDKVMIFAPGALYDILPLWVADNSRCRMQMLDLDKYVPHAAHNRVIAWPMSYSDPDLTPGPSHKAIKFEIKAALLLETNEGRRHRQAWENVHLQATRAERRWQRLEREAGRGMYNLHGRDHDEL